MILPLPTPVLPRYPRYGMRGYVVRLGLYTLLAAAPALLVFVPEAVLDEVVVANWWVVLIYFTLGVTAFAASRLNRGGLALSAGVILALFLLAEEGGVDWASFRPMVTLGLPWSMLLVQLARDAHVLSARGVFRTLLFATPVAVAIAAAAYFPYEYVAVVSPRIAFVPFVTLGAIVSLLVRALFASNFKTREEAFVMALISLPLSYLAFAGAAGEFGMTPSPEIERVAAEAAVAIILAHAAYSMYWRMAYIDELTGIRNRRAFDEYTERSSGQFSVIMMDVDHFKRFNDKHGHEAGDNVLRIVARTLEDVFGKRVFRYGGEEFCAVLRRSGLDAAMAEAELARKGVEAIDFRIRRRKRPESPGGRFLSAAFARLRLRSRSRGGERVPITLSAGVAERSSRSTTRAAALAEADKALYRAKKAGRNRVAR